MVNAVVGITLWTDDLDRMFRFYRDVLRLPLHSFHEDEGFAAFRLGDLRFNVGRHSGVSGASRDPLRMMPHLGVDDIHAEYARLAGRGSGIHPRPGAGALGRLGGHPQRPGRKRPATPGISRLAPAGRVGRGFSERATFLQFADTGLRVQTSGALGGQGFLTSERSHR